MREKSVGHWEPPTLSLSQQRGQHHGRSLVTACSRCAPSLAASSPRVAELSVSQGTKVGSVRPNGETGK